MASLVAASAAATPVRSRQPGMSFAIVRTDSVRGGASEGALSEMVPRSSRARLGYRRQLAPPIRTEERAGRHLARRIRPRARPPDQ